MVEGKKRRHPKSGSGRKTHGHPSARPEAEAQEGSAGHHPSPFLPLICCSPPGPFTAHLTPSAPISVLPEGTYGRIRK